MKTVLSFLLVALFGQPVFGEDLKVYAAAAFKSPLSEIASQYEAATNNQVTLIFDTAGATEQKFRNDPQASLLITTTSMLFVSTPCFAGSCSPVTVFGTTRQSKRALKSPSL
jgi:Bacterial extracellular solute-binding protein